VLRAANILNLAYFDKATLQRMLRNLRARLLPGGLLIVCRTNDAEVNNASVFTLQGDGRFCHHRPSERRLRD
jgi:chemotaxis methyl-accepting protein methylase